MKMIVAFIKENKFDDVMLALHKIDGLTGASSSKVCGFGRDRSTHLPHQKREISLECTSHFRLDIACQSDLVEQVVSAIKQAAHTGLPGDGKIYVLPVEDSIRIRTGERGETAV